MGTAAHRSIWWLASPLAAVLLLFFAVPLVLIGVVSFWSYTGYSITPAFELRNYAGIFDGCRVGGAGPCVVLSTYLSTLFFCVVVWAITLVLGFCIAYFLVFEVRSSRMRIGLGILCTIPFWTSNVIRMISWIPLLGRNGMVNLALMQLHLINHPLEWLLYSRFAVAVAMVHINTVFMIVPLINSMARISPSLIEAARDAGASWWQTLRNIIIPLCRGGIAIGSIFVITVVMGDYITVGLMGGEQIASVGKTIQTQIDALQFPIAAASAVLLLAFVMLMILALIRIVDIREEL
ncbi:MAG: ABC transporter permease [Hyphomicrobiales bacterium]|nr:ABC transporter permease [Hyphomicrobiales bacterium]MDE2115910.1 ABC transporter permease [Hyphomicrobiales bacterium]